jgi:5-methylcytosine-specific restriction endonuclease McrA
VNRWNIPTGLRNEVVLRDTNCVYCGADFSVPARTRGAMPSWEHIVNDARIITRDNIARCCMSCNASKGIKDLGAWLRSRYCERKGITEHTVTEVVRNALIRIEMDTDA